MVKARQKICGALLLASCFAPIPRAGAQAVTTDSVFRTGTCPITIAEPFKWETVAERVDRLPLLLPGTIPFFPMHLRTRDGYTGRIVLSMVVDTVGRVAPGTVSVEESTDPRLSSWGCVVALRMVFSPAIFAGRPVPTLTEQPLSYNASRGP